MTSGIRGAGTDGMNVKKKKTVLFGSIGIARQVLELLLEKEEIELVGVCCEKQLNSWRNEKSVYEYAIETGIPVLENADLNNMKLDVGIAIRYNRIIPQEIIDCFSVGIFNTHGGILPEYRGSFCNINAILNQEKEYGVTLHYIDAGLDAGDIVAIKKIEIDDSCTGFDLYRESEKLCYQLIEENIDNILQGKNDRIPQSVFIDRGHKCNIYKAAATLKAKELSVEDLNSDKAVRVIRAFDSDGHEPAYVNIKGKKIYLRVRC